MFKLNRKLEYSLIALKHMLHKRPGELTTAKEIADNYGCSFDTTARVLQIMTHKKWLQSSQGISGGYVIVKDLAHVSFYDLSESLLGPIKLARCISSQCQYKKNCNIVSPVQNLNKHFVRFYMGLSILQILTEEPSFDQTHPSLTSKLKSSVPLNTKSGAKPPLQEAPLVSLNIDESLVNFLKQDINL